MKKLDVFSCAEEKITGMGMSVIKRRKGVDGNVLLAMDASGEPRLVEATSPKAAPLSRGQLEEIAIEMMFGGDMRFPNGTRIHFDVATVYGNGALVDYREDVQLMDGQDEALDVGDRIDPSLARRGMDAAADALKRRGYDVLQMPRESDRGSDPIVAYDPIEKQIVLVDVTIRRGYFAEKAWTDGLAMRLERATALFALRTSDLPTGDWRYDIVAINVQGDDRAFLRHHINAWPDDGDE